MVPKTPGHPPASLGKKYVHGKKCISRVAGLAAIFCIHDKPPHVTRRGGKTSFLKASRACLTPLTVSLLPKLLKLSPCSFPPHEQAEASPSPGRTQQELLEAASSQATLLASLKANAFYKPRRQALDLLSLAGCHVDQKQFQVGEPCVWVL
eukprot:366131-Chlamydomonas_euryale.AAC.30